MINHMERDKQNKGGAVFLLLLAEVLCVLNDAFVKLLPRIPTIEITCGRYFFATLTLLPFIFIDKKTLMTRYLHIHVLRSIVFCSALCLWQVGLKTTIMSSVNLIGSSGPFFLLILSLIFLRERFTFVRFITSLFSFLSVFLIIDFNELSFTSGSAVLLFSNVLFAISDVVNKKFATKESQLTMVFYFNLVSFLVCFVPTYVVFVVPNVIELVYMVCLGGGASLMLYLCLKSFALADASFLSPFKYSEFVFSVIFGYLLFNEVPHKYSLVAFGIIITCNIYLYMKERK